MDTYNELKAAFDEAERIYKSAYRRTQWLENRLMKAADNDEFYRLNAELEAQEKRLKVLSLDLIKARYNLGAADLS